MCWVWAAASWTRLSRCRRRDRTAHTVSGGRKDPRRRPTEWRYWSHWQSWTSVFRPGTFLTCRAFTRQTSKPPRLQDLVQGDPVDPGGLHGHGGDAALGEPVGEGLQVLGEGPEAPDGLGIPVERHAHVDLGGADVDPGGVRVQDRRGDGTGDVAAGLWAWRLLLGGGVKAMASRRPKSWERRRYSSNRDRPRRGTHIGGVTSDLRTRPGTMLTNGLTTSAPVIWSVYCLPLLAMAPGAYRRAAPRGSQFLRSLPQPPAGLRLTSRGSVVRNLLRPPAKVFKRKPRKIPPRPFDLAFGLLVNTW